MAVYKLEPTRVCAKCHAEKPSVEGFEIYPACGKMHIRNICRDCINAARRSPEKWLKACRECGVLFIRRSRNGQVCSECRPKVTRSIKSQSNRRYPEKMRAAKLRWREANQEEWLAYMRHARKLRRARIAGAEGRHSRVEFEALCKIKDWRCTYCQRKLRKSEVTEDHMTPLVRGGSNYIDNITPACRSCNARKGTLTYDEFVSRLANAA